MKRVKCYGKAKYTIVETSFKKKFFDSFHSKNSFGKNSFQEFQKNRINSCTTNESASDYTNITSPALFTSDSDSVGESFPTFSTYNLRNVNRKQKSVKHLVSKKTRSQNKFPDASAYHSSDLQTVCCKTSILSVKHTGMPKSYIKQRSSKEFKTPAKLTSSYSFDSDLCTKVRTKNFKCLHSYNNVATKRRNKARCPPKKNSSIPIKPSSLDFCKNASPGMRAKRNKGIGKKNNCIDKEQVVSINSNLVAPFQSKQSSFWDAKWSSILEYSFEIEEILKEKKKVSSLFFKQHVNAFDVTDGINCGKSDDFSKQIFDSTINETADNKLKAAKDILQKEAVCASVVNAQNFEIGNVEFCEKNALGLCEILTEKLKVNENASVRDDEGTRWDKVTETFEEGVGSKKGNEDFMRQTSSITCKTDSKKDFFKENELLLENVDSIPKSTFSILSEKSKGFCSSTPLASPSKHSTKAKFYPNRAFTPDFKKGSFTTSTPNLSSKKASAGQNQPCDMSKSSRLVISRSLQAVNIDSSIKLQKFSLTGICSVLSRSISRRESHSFIKHKSVSNKTQYSSVAYSSAESDFKSTLSTLLEICGQTSIIPFRELYDWSQTTLRKIGEGTYGEVFTITQKRISSVVKVIPFSEDKEDHNMQSIESVLSEITVSQCLSELRNNKNYKTRNFNKLKSVHLVRGCYPDQMLVAWDKFSVARSTYNLRPDIFNDEQMFAIIELEYGGKDMTCFILRNAAEAESVLKQIMISLAIAEEVHLFEHRDLHLGNILVQRNASKSISYILGGKTFSIENHGLVITIIDFTLSRVLHKGCIFYNDLAGDDSLFNQTGDCQFQIYKDTKFLLNNEWDKCLLYSNVLWLTFLCVKLLEYTYSRPSSNLHKKSLNNIKIFQNNLKTCKSAFECLSACNILTSIPENVEGSAKRKTMKVKLVDRSSTRISHISNIA